MSKTRQIATWYTDASDVEHDITVTVSAAPWNGLNAIELSELPDMPADEKRALAERVSEAYWAAEHSDWLLTPEAEARGL